MTSFPNMKQRIYIILALAAAVACSKTDVVYDDAQTGEITVSPVTGTLTKAAISDGVYPESNHIALFAYHAPLFKAGAVTSTDYARFNDTYLYDAEYHYTGTPQSTRIWSGLVSSYYWPITGSLVFAGYSLPAPETPGTSSKPIGTEVNYDLSTDKLEIKGYAQSAETDKTFDLLYFGRTSTSYNNRRDGASVSLTFNHALSWITVQIKGGDGALVDGRVWSVTEVTLKDVQTKGDFTYLGTAEPPTPKVSWELEDDDSDMSVYGPSSKPLSNAFVTFEKNPAGLVVIPQAAKKLEVKIRYQSPADDTIDEIVEVDLSKYTTNWEAGKKYTYQLTFDPEKILVNPTVSAWPNPGEVYTPSEIE